ncbi:Orn/Lys/Arg decarboxylase N-terminal domain-containing protein [Candidatus Haliotispira prima]|uniref:Orn/Lys/Arg decarboxylase N-terminal domain-containing protein n=1 Tax=Candidatus Haliotispira prima TaxID=3034016 RepID=A0ABY8MID6_9SPIO|nr:Orn/Lys/Arg decarboxylase N-terminal domain-containing protein [Candidatus Haliotispira prima]
MTQARDSHDQYLVNSLPILIVYAGNSVKQDLGSRQETAGPLFRAQASPPTVPYEHADHSLSLLAEIRDRIRSEGFHIRELDHYGDFLDLGSRQHFSALVFSLPSDHLPGDHLSGDNLAYGSGAYGGRTTGGYRLLDEIVTHIRHYNEDVPIFLYGKQKEYTLLSEDVIRNTTGFIHYGEDTVEFTARYISREARYYLKTCLPAFFRNLMEHVYNGSYSWHCPGHSGGTAFLKSPVGSIFHRFFGENLLRADVCNAVESLGQLLEHTGHIGSSERNAAHVFRADRLYFVTNGTSTSNKIVAHANITRGDVVLVDRNCHQSILHAMIQTGAIPIFLRPSRNAQGVVGPIPEEQFSPEWIEAAIMRNPLVPESFKQANKRAGLQVDAETEDKAGDEAGNEAAAGQEAKTPPRVGPKALILTQSTYDGLLYNSHTIQQKLDGYIPVLHFDEAWIPHAVFHDFYFAMHAMGDHRPATEHSTIYATQSTHKLLAGLSQASQILVQNAKSAPLDPAPMEASFLMHTSTSPQYSILASLDVTSAMMSGAHGYAIVEEALVEALSFRQALRKYGEGLEPDTWWFQDWGPQRFSSTNPYPEWLDEAAGLSSFEPQQNSTENLWQKEWRLDPGNKWHGFDHERSPDFNMLDPIKCTLLTPGPDEDGRLREWGIPAVVVSRYLEENGIIVEKTGLYSIFVMFTIGITKGRWKSLLSALQRFKVDYDMPQSLWQSMPQLCQQYPQYADLNIRELCRLLHDGYRNSHIVEQTNLAYSGFLLPKATPGEAYNSFIRGDYESLPASRVGGRVSASMISIYPPGIPLVFPGEVISEEVQRYLSCIEQQQRRFPGFEIHIHGVKIPSLKERAVGEGEAEGTVLPADRTPSFLVNVLKEG